MKHTWVIAIAIMGLLGASALAQPGQGGLRADKDGDGKVSFDELKAARPNATEDMFKRLDADGDGYLTRADREARGGQRPGGFGGFGGPQGPGGPQAFGGPGGPEGGPRNPLAMADTNNDGQVSLDEWMTAHRTRFQQLDENNDGVLDQQEMNRGMGPRGGQQPGTFGEGPQAGRQRDGQGRGLSRADADGDGKVSFEELKKIHPEANAERFKAMDRNGDGYLSADDREGKQGQGPGRGRGRGSQN